MRIALPVSSQMHRARAKVKVAAGDAIGVRHHREARRSVRISTVTLGRRPENAPTMPVKFHDRATARRIKGKLRILILKYQKVAIDIHWDKSKQAVGERDQCVALLHRSSARRRSYN